MPAFQWKKVTSSLPPPVSLLRPSVYPLVFGFSLSAPFPKHSRLLEPSAAAYGKSYWKPWSWFLVIVVYDVVVLVLVISKYRQ